MVRSSCLVGLSLIVASACGGSRDDEQESSGVSITGVTTTGGGSTSSDTADTGDKLDVGNGSATQGTAEGGDGKGCKGIDFLFVIDNSGSMSDEQQNLISSFPGFVMSIENKLAELEATNFHILVTDTDAATIPPPNPACLFECTMNPMGTCSVDNSPCALTGDPNCLITCTQNINGMCTNGLECSDLVDCGADGCPCELGAGKIEDMNGAPCGVQGNQRYIVDGQPNLEGVFACLAEVGTQGSGAELQAQGLIAALSDQLNAPGGCNEAFLRDDAILVATLITDEEDSPDDAGSPGDPAGWKQSVLAAKKGDEAGVVMLGLVGDSNTPNAVCNGFDGNAGGEESPRLREFVSSFQNHVLGSVCEPNYASFFEQAVDLIQTTCQDYIPPQG